MGGPFGDEVWRILAFVRMLHAKRNDLRRGGKCIGDNGHDELCGKLE